MKLKFRACGDLLVAERASDGTALPVQVGIPRRYVGRMFDAEAKAYPACEEPYCCDAGTVEAAYLARCCKDSDLAPYDAETAKAISCTYVPADLKDGVWVPKASAKDVK